MVQGDKLDESSRAVLTLDERQRLVMQVGGAMSFLQVV